MKRLLLILLLSLLFFVKNVNALTEAPVDINVMSATEISDALDKGYFTSEQLVNMYLERIEKYDSLFNSMNQINANAVEDAKTLDLERKNGKVRSKLHGVPIVVKCNIDVLGIPTTGGTKSLSDNYPKENAYVVQKLIDAGAIILGSTNMSELAFSAGNSYSSYGHVKNVFNVNYTPYGSSGGSAVAVTASFAALSLGTDTNSSVRIPAAGAGLVGLRPTLGLVSRSGVIPYDIERDTVGILSKCVEDNALILSIIGGVDQKDEYTKNSLTKEYDVSNASLKGVVIGVSTQMMIGNSSNDAIIGETDLDIKDMMEESVMKMKEAGATIIYLDDFLQYKYYKVAYSTYAGITMCDNFNEYIKGTTGTIRSFSQLNKSSGHVQRLVGYVDGCGEHYKDKSVRDNIKEPYKEYVESIYEEYDLDVIVYPTMKNKVYKIGKGSNRSPGSVISSVIGYPSITVPMGFIEGFSYGMEILSLPYNEETLYNVAASYEAVNNNVNVTSSLTPSLYVISDNVNKLVIKYEENLNNIIVKEWINKVKQFFLEYNNIENKDAKALELLNSYPLSSLDEIKKIDDSVKIIIIVGLLVIIFYFIKFIDLVEKKIKRLKKKRKKR